MNLQRFQTALDDAARHQAQPSDPVRVVMEQAGTPGTYVVVAVEWNPGLTRLEIRAVRG